MKIKTVLSNLLLAGLLSCGPTGFANANQSQEESEAYAKADTPAEVRRAVVEVFGANSIMIDIARCESEFRQFNADGSVLTGEADPRDTGVMQINTRWHEVTAEELGYDIRTLEGNLAYAEHLYQEQGTTPWDSSSRCWG